MSAADRPDAGKPEPTRAPSAGWTPGELTTHLHQCLTMGETRVPLWLKRRNGDPEAMVAEQIGGVWCLRWPGRGHHTVDGPWQDAAADHWRFWTDDGTRPKPFVFDESVGNYGAWRYERQPVVRWPSAPRPLINTSPVKPALALDRRQIAAPSRGLADTVWHPPAGFPRSSDK